MNTCALTILEARKEAARVLGMQVPFTARAMTRVPSAIYGSGESGFFDKSKVIPGFAPNGSQLAGRPAENPAIQASIPQSAHDTKSKSLAVKNQTTKAMTAFNAFQPPQSVQAKPAGPQPIPEHIQNAARTMSGITGTPAPLRATTIGSRTTEIGKAAQYLALAVLRGRTVA